MDIDPQMYPPYTDFSIHPTTYIDILLFKFHNVRKWKSIQ